MSRSLIILALLAGPVGAAGPAGTWKFRFADGEQPVTLLLALSEAGGRWTGDFIGSSAQLVQEPKFAAVAVAGDGVRFALTFGGRPFIDFDGVLAKDGKKLSGSYTTRPGGQLLLTDLHPSKLKKLDDTTALARENVAQFDAGPELFAAGFAVADAAGAKKVPVEEVRGLADKLAKAAAAYGGRWEQSVALKLATALAGQKGYEDVALAQARRSERMLSDDAPAATQLDVFDALARVLAAAGKPDDAKKYDAAAARVEAKDAADYAKSVVTFPFEKFVRKGKGDRAVLAEVFTGAECPPCVAVDVAADALLMTYSPADVIVLQYHFHVPDPDPLTSPDGMERVAHYADVIRAAPLVLLNGKPVTPGGGPLSAAKGKYAELRAAIEPLLEKPAGVKLAVSVAKGAKGYTAKATVSDLETPGEKVSLRFVLAEEVVRYAGGNGVRYHRHVVRATPGGPKGFPLTKRSAEQTVEFDPAEIREGINAYLDDYAKKEREFPRPDRPLGLRNLKLVAMVQNDATLEVLQAVQADVAP
jgi:hypothetical protein